VRICEDGECGPCQCLPWAEPTPDPEPGVTFYADPDGRAEAAGTEADPWSTLDWPVIDDALGTRHVRVLFRSDATWSDKLLISRTDIWQHRLVLDGATWPTADDRATVPGISTGFDDVPRHRVTVRGFEVTGSRDKGVYWRGGDARVLEDLVVHDNQGSPAVSLDYANRTGLHSMGFSLRNSHVYDQTGECVYIGGSEGEDLDSHAQLVLERNLIHHCWSPISSQHDGINVKDRITGVTITDNVIFEVDWAIEVASPAVISGNLMFDLMRNGFHLSDSWGLGLSGVVLRDNAVISPHEDGLYLGANRLPWTDVMVDGLVVADAGVAAILAASDGGVQATLDRVVLVDSATGVEGWGTPALTFLRCQSGGHDEAPGGVFEGALTDCSETAWRTADLSLTAGPDGLWLTDDDPWRQSLLAWSP
jgi:hypothetical protein